MTTILPQVIIKGKLVEDAWNTFYDIGNGDVHRILQRLASAHRETKAFLICAAIGLCVYLAVKWFKEEEKPLNVVEDNPVNLQAADQVENEEGAAHFQVEEIARHLDAIRFLRVNQHLQNILNQWVGRNREYAEQA